MYPCHHKPLNRFFALQSLLLGLVLLVLTRTAIATEPLNERTVVALFGDSISVGFNANFQDRNGNGTTDRGCPTIYLTNLMLNDGDHPSCSSSLYNSPVFDANNEARNIIVTNWGEGGTDTDRGQARINAHLGQAKIDFVGNSYITLIMYGTNDRNSGISSTTTRDNIGIMIDRARVLGFTPILSNLTPRSDQNVGTYNSQIASLVGSKNVLFVDMHSRFVNHSGGYTQLIDQEISTLTGETIRLHPNNEGYLVIAETWFDQHLKNIIPAIENQTNIAPIISLLLDE